VAQAFGDDVHRPRRDLRGVVFHPAGLREDLAVLQLMLPARQAMVVEDDEPRARRALIQRADKSRHGGDNTPMSRP
jgi:tRNA U54 and U55 pseudouridine synthase Pus10